MIHDDEYSFCVRHCGKLNEDNGGRSVYVICLFSATEDSASSFCTGGDTHSPYQARKEENKSVLFLIWGTTRRLGTAFICICT